jgi:glycosyltransferase involved in cell wall biosynthesis
MKVMFFTQTAESGAASRYRVYQYLDYLRKRGIECMVAYGASNSCTRRVTEKNRLRDKINFYYLEPFIRRAKNFFRVKDYDVIFIQRDLLLYFPALFELLIFKMGKKIVFDYDDALFEAPNHMKYPIFYYLRGKNKIANIVRWSRHVVAGNKHLADYALRLNKNVTIIPTSIDLDRYKISSQVTRNKTLIIGWIGRPGSVFYIEKIAKVFIELAKKYEFVLKIVGATAVNIPISNLIVKPWRLEDEVNDIKSFDIGLMPLTEDAWAEGKSATKLLEYMAAGVSVVCSPVGVNKNIVKDGENGFYATTEEEWIEKISRLITDQQLRKTFSEKGQLTVKQSYSIQANASKLEEVLLKVYRET